MSPEQLAGYLGGAAAYALLTGGGGLLLLHAFGRGPGRAGAALLLLTLFFVFLALHPFPDRAMLDCSRGGKAVRLRPFAFLDEAVRLFRQGRGPAAWLGNLALASAAMNFGLCAAIGAAFAGMTGKAGRWRHAALFGAGLTLAIELTQLTGNWRIYPCPYRNFDVDDLLLNLAGVMAGFGIWRWLSPGPDRR